MDDQTIIDDTVQLYSFRYKIGDRAYGGHIPALSFEDAKTKAAQFGATIDGVAVKEVYTHRTCSACGGNVTVDVSSPELLSDEWDEEFE